MSQTFTVDERAAGQRLDVVLASLTGASRSQIRGAIGAGAVTVNGQLKPASYPVHPHDALVYTPATTSSQPATPPHLETVYEDNDMLVVDKPARLTVHAGAGTAGEGTVADFARQHTTDTDADRPGIVHRLDRDTSGLLMIAKNPATKAFLQSQLAAHAITKIYTALVVGRLEPDHATIDLPIGRDPANPLRQAVVPSGRTARTHYRVLAAYPGYTLVQATLETGRTHQLRVHFAATGHPIAGDTTYGKPGRSLGLTRQFLHATKLTLVTPSGQHLTLTSPLPPDLQDCLSQLEKSV